MKLQRSAGRVKNQIAPDEPVLLMLEDRQEAQRVTGDLASLTAITSP